MLETTLGSRPLPQGPSVWFIPLPGFWQVAIAGGHDELVCRCEEYLAAATTEDEKRVASAGIFSLLTLVSELFHKGVRYLGVGVFRRDTGALSTAALSLTVLNHEFPDGGAARLALAAIIESKWAGDPLPLDVPAGPAMKWTGTIKARVPTDSDGFASPNFTGICQTSVAITHIPTRRIVVLQCCTPDAGELENYSEMIEFMATTVWFDGVSPHFQDRPQLTHDFSHIRSVLG